jgi:acyl-[acyl carrier protein]--UDP-N-acetylglucosamine O-acyltransferase
LRRLYHTLFRRRKNLRTAIAEAQKNFSSATAKVLLDFVAGARRGLCADTGRANKEDEEA